MRRKLSVMLCIVALSLISLVVISPGHGWFGETEIVNQRYEIEKQVDPTRYVDEAFVTNNARGDRIVEFVAQRQDQTRERWTAHFQMPSDTSLMPRSPLTEIKRSSSA